MSLLAGSGVLTCALRGCCGLGVFLLPVRAADGTIDAHAVDALASCKDGGIDYLVVRIRGVGRIAEPLHRLPWSEALVHKGAILTKRPASEFRALAVAKAA